MVKIVFAKIVLVHLSLVKKVLACLNASYPLSAFKNGLRQRGQMITSTWETSTQQNLI